MKPRLMGALSAGKRALLQALREEAGLAARPPGNIPARHLTSAPLSFAQERLWLVEQLHPEAAAYNDSVALELQGALDTIALREALTEVMERQGSLRTRIVPLEGLPEQEVVSSLDLPLEEAPAQPGHLAELCTTEARRPFDLERAPLWRARLHRLSPTHYVLQLTLHHLICDGWSHAVLLREWAACYRARMDGSNTGLTPLPITYLDVAGWQREHLAGEREEAMLAYWRKQLEGLPPVSEIPSEHPRPAAPSFQGERLALKIPREVMEELHRLAQRERVTPFMVLLGALQALVHRTSGQDDVAVGSPVSNRYGAQTEALVGVFVNMLVLRATFASDPSFRAVLRQVRETALGAYAHQELPFERVVQALQPDRRLNLPPFFQTVLALQTAPPPPLSLPGVTARPYPVAPRTSKFGLVFNLWESEGELEGWLEYASDLYDREAAERIAEQWTALLTAAVRSPEVPLSRLPLLTPEARRRIVEEWNDTARPYARERTIPQLLEAQSDAAPGALAVWEPGGRRYTHGELEARANQIARLLQAGGAGPGTLVAVHMERSVELLPTLLGILKAGAAYVPLDTTFPLKRVEWILRHLEIRTVVTQRSLAEPLGGIASLTALLVLDAEGAPAPAGVRVWGPADLEAQPPTRPRSLATADDPAYVIFTSGSTGTPKGVVVRHRPVINLFEWVNRTFGVGPADRLLFVTSISFDLSVYDMFGILAAGGSSCVASRDDVLAAPRLASLLSSERITFWDSAPAALQHIVGHIPRGGAPALRQVFLSGDWIPVTLPDQLRSVSPSAQVTSLGGATEATVWSNAFPIEKVDPRWPSIPYGRPIQNARYYVLDAHLEPCPVAVAGDLFIGGECLADGYAGAPELTAERFVQDPFVRREGALMYRTGDRARFFADGNLQFLGRADNQVKVRGYRIELGEIESVLLEYPAVRQAVVTVDTGADGEKRLIAYLVSSLAVEWRPHGESMEVHDFRRRASLRVPLHLGCTATHEHHSWTAQLLDVSAGGCCLSSMSEPRLEVDQRVVLRVVLPGVDGEQSLAGRVVWRRGPLAGVQWEDGVPRDVLAGCVDQVLSTAGLSLSALRSYLKDRLPEYMLPSVFILIDTLPLTPSGKLDLRALPKPDPARSELARAPRAASDATEQRLVAIWEEVLGVNPVGVTDNFFELGGHSLLAVRMMAEVSRSLNRRLPLSVIFEGATIEQLAKAVRATSDTARRSCVVDLLPGSSGRPFFWIHAAGGHVLPYAGLASQLAPDFHLYGLEAIGLNDSSSPLETVEEMARRYLESLRAIQPEGPYLLAGWSFGGLVAYELARLLTEAGQRVDATVLLDSPPPGDAQAGGDGAAVTVDEAAAQALLAHDLAARGSDVTALKETGLWDDLLRVLIAHLRAEQRFRPTPFEGRVLYLRAVDNPLSPAALAAWREQLGTRLEEIVLAGDHDSVLAGDPLRGLTRVLRSLGLDAVGVRGVLSAVS